MTCAWTFHVRRYRFASPAEARERAKATLLDPSNPKEHVRLTYMMECICVLRMCRQVCLTVSLGACAEWAQSCLGHASALAAWYAAHSPPDPCRGRTLCYAPRALAERKGMQKMSAYAGLVFAEVYVCGMMPRE